MPIKTRVRRTLPITPEDLAELGVDAQLIPFIVSTTSQIERSPNGPPPLGPVEAENLIEILDKIVSSATVDPNLKNRCFRVLRKVSPAHGILPKSYFPPGVTLSDIPYASGGFADVWKGQQDGKPVCVKAFRIQPAANLYKVKRRFYREIVGWKYISHPNVLPFLGVLETSSSFCIATPWLPNGNILEYIRKYQGVNRLQLLAQAACGLEYLHSRSIVHSNITPGNILITEEGNARLGDFGITAVITDPSVVERDSTTTSKPGVIHYMAPELLNPPWFGLDHSSHSKESDVFSFAMTTYEVLSGVLPYSAEPETVIALQIASGNRPAFPDNPTANRWLLYPIWDVLQDCWAQIPQYRSPIGLLYQAFVESDPEQKGSIPLTKNGEDAAPSPPKLSSSEEKGQTQNTRPSTEPPRGPPVHTPSVKLNPLKKLLDGIRSLVRRVFHHRHR